LSIVKDSDTSQLVTAIANAITKKTLAKINDAKAEVEAYLDNHLESIVTLGLGITKDSWGSYKLESTGFSGLIADYVRGLARAAAEGRVDALVQKVVDHRAREMLSRGLGDAARRHYVEAYREKLQGLIRDHLSSREKEFRSQLELVIGETGIRLNALAADQLKALIKSIEASDA